MSRNHVTWDRTLRLLPAVIDGALAIALDTVAANFLVTSFINFCPQNAVLGDSTLNKKIPGA